MKTISKFTYNQIVAQKEFLPFYVYAYEAIKRQILKLRKHLPSNVKVYYSVKANPNIAILRIMKKFGLSAEIVSEGELFASQRAGFNSADILFGGARKSDNDFLMAAKKGIGLISLESLSEIERFEKIAKMVGTKPAVLLRLNLEDTGVRQGGGDYKTVHHFGISLAEFKKIASNFGAKFPNLNLKGIHVYETSRVFDSGILINKIEQVFFTIRQLQKRSGFNVEIFDIGGGFGLTPRRELSVLDFGNDLGFLINKYQLNDNLIILELGRYLINGSGYFISPIIDIQKSDNQNFLIIKGLVNHLLRIFDKSSADFRFKETLDDYPVNILPERKNIKKESFVICGQLSSLADTFGRRLDCCFSLPRPQKGDLIVIGQVGGYGLTQSFAFFGSRPMAAEFLLINGRLELIRDRGRAEDFLRNQIIPKTLKNERR